MRTKLVMATAAAVALSTTAATAADFYAGKTVTIIVGLAAGGGYDTYARFLSRHLDRHIPGKPNIVVSNMTGAASATAAAYVYNKGAKDGTVMAMTLDMVPLYRTLSPKRGRFDMTKAHFIGNMATLNGVIAVSDKSPVKTVADLGKNQAILGSTGAMSQTYIIPALLNELSGANFKIVMGFPGTRPMDLAIERGELHGRGGQWSSFLINKPDWIKDRKILPLLQIGMEEDPTMKGVPSLNSLAKNDRQKSLYRLASQLPRLSRALWVAPEVPAERVEILRKAFDATMKDKETLAAAAKIKMEISPTSPKEIQAAVKDMNDTADANVEFLQKLVSVTPPKKK